MRQHKLYQLALLRELLIRACVRTMTRQTVIDHTVLVFQAQLILQKILETAEDLSDFNFGTNKMLVHINPGYMSGIIPTNWGCV